CALRRQRSPRPPTARRGFSTVRGVRGAPPPRAGAFWREEVPVSPSPDHVAIIMDGNGRWAAARGAARADGHRQGAEAVRRVVRAARELGIPHLTLYAFSEQNWGRPEAEVAELMRLLLRF